MSRLQTGREAMENSQAAAYQSIENLNDIGQQMLTDEKQ